MMYEGKEGRTLKVVSMLFPDTVLHCKKDLENSKCLFLA
jgi:hypothetical protein